MSRIGFFEKKHMESCEGFRKSKKVPRPVPRYIHYYQRSQSPKGGTKHLNLLKMLSITTSGATQWLIRRGRPSNRSNGLYNLEQPRVIRATSFNFSFS